MLELNGREVLEKSIHIPLRLIAYDSAVLLATVPPDPFCSPFLVSLARI